MGYHNQFDFMKSLELYYWYINLPQCGYVEHGLKYITFYVQKHIAPLAICCNLPLVRDKPLGASAFVGPVYTNRGGVITHYNDVIMGAIASQITSLTIVYSIVYSDADQRKHQSSASLALCVGNSPWTGEFPAQMTSYAENVSIWWHHHDLKSIFFVILWRLCMPRVCICVGTTHLSSVIVGL